MTKRDPAKDLFSGVRARQNGSDDGHRRRDAILNIVDELRFIRDRASDLGLGDVVRVIDAALIATARQIDMETGSLEDLDD